MSRLLRSGVVCGVLLATFWLGVATASADVIFDESAQQAFGVDADGNDTGGGSGSLQAAWRAFITTEEGQRILAELEASEVPIEISVRPPDEVGEGHAYGTTRGLDWVDKMPTRVEIRIASDAANGVLGTANTIHHEFRHAEIYFGGPSFEVRRTQHDRLDAGKDALNEHFDIQLDAVLQERIHEVTEVLGSDLLDAETPIYDSIKARADDQQRLGFIARDLGYILDTDPPSKPTIQFAPIGIDGATRVRVALQGFDGTPVMGGACGTSTEGRTIVCPDGEKEFDPDDVIGIGVDLEKAVESFIEGSFELNVDVDTDGDPGNDRPGDSDDDPTAGTDTTFGATYDPTGGWGLRVIGPDGAVDSGAALVVEGDTVTFLVPGGEIPGGDDAAFRVSATTTVGDETSTDVLVDSAADDIFGIPSQAVPSGCAGGDSPFGPACDAHPETNVSSIDMFTDSDGYIWIQMNFEQPWGAAPPSDLFSFGVVWNLALGDDGFTAMRWSVHDDITEGLGVVGSQVTSIDAYLTPGGSLVGRMPGSGLAEGYASLFGHRPATQSGDGYRWEQGPLVVTTITQYLEEDIGAEPIPRVSTFPVSLDELLTDPPVSEWLPIEVDVGPIVLEVPGS